MQNHNDRIDRNLHRQVIAAFDANDLPAFEQSIHQLEVFSLTHCYALYSDVMHIRHTLLGLFALRAGDKTTAILELLRSGKVPSSPTLKSFGPNMLLAQELLEAGEPEAVLQYLRFCRSFWALPFYLLKVPGWEKAIRRGEQPRFGANLLYHLNWDSPGKKR